MYVTYENNYVWSNHKSGNLSGKLYLLYIEKEIKNSNAKSAYKNAKM